MTDFRSLCARMADELDHYRQLLMDDRREAHALATEARAALAQPPPPTDGEVAELVAALRNDAECAEVEHYDLCNMTAQQMRRAADLLEHLAQPEPQGPTDDELYDLWDQEGTEADFQECRRFARAVLARWGSRTPAPIPLSERYPNLRPNGDDFSKDGCLWWYEPRLKWRWAMRDAIDCIPYPTHWLPHWALPMPAESER
jgi:hypothetical protein